MTTQGGRDVPEREKARSEGTRKGYRAEIEKAAAGGVVRGHCYRLGRRRVVVCTDRGK